MEIDTGSSYFSEAENSHRNWCAKMNRQSSLLHSTTKGIQRWINQKIPESVHKFITKTIKEITRAILSGSGITTGKHERIDDFQGSEEFAKKRIKFYASSSAAEGAITGFGGFFAGLSDFPLWLTLKMKMLFEIAHAYDFDISDYRERLYILYIFQLTFSAQDNRRKIFGLMKHWDDNLDTLPETYHDFDWRTFQLEYRDHIDLAKLIQLIPGIGAIAGAIVNHRYTELLGENAMQAYRMRFSAFDKDATQ